MNADQHFLYRVLNRTLTSFSERHHAMRSARRNPCVILTVQSHFVRCIRINGATDDHANHAIDTLREKGQTK